MIWHDRSHARRSPPLAATESRGCRSRGDQDRPGVLDRAGHPAPQGASPKIHLHDGRQRRDRHRLDRILLAALPVNINLARGLHRTWVVCLILWVIYWTEVYDSSCSSWDQGTIKCDFNPFHAYYFYGAGNIIEWFFGIPILIYILGAVALWAGRWV